jgi:hypothetical protein
MNDTEALFTVSWQTGSGRFRPASARSQAYIPLRRSPKDFANLGNEE